MARAVLPVAAEARATARRDFFERRSNSKRSFLVLQKRTGLFARYETDIVSRENNTTCSGGCACLINTISLQTRAGREEDMPSVRCLFIYFYFFKNSFTILFSDFRAYETPCVDEEQARSLRLADALSQNGVQYVTVSSVCAGCRLAAERYC